jgi:hypothetical protein
LASLLHAGAICSSDSRGSLKWKTARRFRGSTGSTFAAFGLLSLAVPAAAQNAPRSPEIVRPGPSVHVSVALPSDPHYEMEIASNPEDAGQLVACSMVFPNDSPATDVVTYVSSDAGKSWKLALRTQGEGGHQSWDPDCRYGPDHVLYSLSEGLGSNYTDGYDRIDRSTDGGNTWETFSRTVHAERSFLAVDERPGPHHGWVYLYGMGNDPGNIRVGYSPDGGKTFFTQLVPLEQGTHVVNVGPGAILSDGTLVIPMPVVRPPQGELPQDFRINLPGQIRLVRVNFQRPNWPLKVETSTVSPWFADLEPNGSYYTTLAVDTTQGPFRDRIYAVWEDRSSGRLQVKLSFSADKGETWPHPRVIDDDVPRQVGDSIHGPDDIHGVVAVNTQGVVGVMWLDRREHPDDLGWAVRFRASLDGGETFLPSVKASNADYDPSRNGRVPLFGDGDWAPEVQSTNALSIGWFTFHGGHTMGLTADAEGVFHPLWMANPTGTPQLWTTDIAVQGHAEKNGDPELAKLADASKFVRLEFLNRYYNLKTHSLDFDLRLENSSEARIHSPLKVRVLDVGSYVGSVTIQAEGAERSAEGALWDFTPRVSRGVFQPGDITEPLHIHLIVSGIDPFSQIGRFSLFETPLAILTTKVLAGSIELEKQTKTQE